MYIMRHYNPDLPSASGRISTRSDDSSEMSLELPEQAQKVQSLEALEVSN